MRSCENVTRYNGVYWYVVRGFLDGKMQDIKAKFAVDVQCKYSRSRFKS